VLALAEQGAVVFIGKKPFMNYVTGVVMQFNSGVKKVCIKARGKYISRAVDVVEVVRHRFIPDVKLDKVDINSEEFEGQEGRKVRVSTIELTLSK
jgi:DNA-binding protein